MSLPLLGLLGWALTGGIAPAQAATQTFGYTGGEQTFAVPSGVNKVQVLLVGKRRRMLRYLERTDLERYRALVADLGLRR